MARHPHGTSRGLPVSNDLADWFGRTSLPQAHGRNVVNVIIVDFRALDTLGEIAVVAFSLLAALPLLAALGKGHR
jgi:multicomponent Na+:H+ antiporter subunit A